MIVLVIILVTSTIMLSLDYFRSVQSKNNDEIKYNFQYEADVNRDYETNDESHAKKSTQQHIILGAGRGATGTHSMTEATCLLGYPSIHYNLGCIPQKAINETNDEKPIPSDYQELYDLTWKITVALHHAVNCSVKKENCPNAIEFRNFLRNAIQNLISFVVTMKKEIAFHDYPFSDILPSVLDEIQRYNNDSMSDVTIRPIILLSQRDPSEYTTRRIKKRQSKNDLVCKSPAPISSFKSMQGTIGVEGGGFDIMGCLDQALSGLNSTKAKALTLSDVFTTMATITNKGHDVEGLRKVINYVDEYQKSVNVIADFSYDMFAQNNKTLKEELANHILNQTVLHENQQHETCQYVNFWKNEVLTDETLH